MEQRLVARAGEEHLIPHGHRYSIETDAKYFDLESLVRMYGLEAVQSWWQAAARRGELGSGLRERFQDLDKER